MYIQVCVYYRYVLILCVFNVFLYHYDYNINMMFFFILGMKGFLDFAPSGSESTDVWGRVGGCPP